MSMSGVNPYNSSKTIKLTPPEHDELDRMLLAQKLRPSTHACFPSDFEDSLTESLVELACSSEPLTLVLETQPEIPFSEPRSLGDIFNIAGKEKARTTNGSESDFVTELSAKHLYYLDKAFKTNWTKLNDDQTHKNAAMNIGTECSKLSIHSTNLMNAYGGKFQQKYRALAAEMFDYIVEKAQDWSGTVDEFVTRIIKTKLTKIIADNNFASSEEVEYFLTACSKLWTPLLNQDDTPVCDYYVSLKSNDHEIKDKLNFNVGLLLFKAYHEWMTADEEVKPIPPATTTKTAGADEEEVVVADDEKENKVPE